ncbi:hypothetical protein BC826DRAFT_519794 [Russula brevipes]|nr:hypothetical protein BC826DRAFT_519794 [Russula brevipes]
MNLSLGTRRSAASSSTTTLATNPVKDDFPEALTYRYNDNSAWVPAARTHEVGSSLFQLSFGLFDKKREIHRMNTGGHRPRETRLSRTAERPPRLHHVPHDGQVEHRMHHAGGMATRGAAAAAVPRRGRADPGHGGLEDESGLPEYPYYAAAYTLPSEKGEGSPQKEQPNHRESTEPSGNRLRRMMSFVRGTDS